VRHCAHAVYVVVYVDEYSSIFWTIMSDEDHDVDIESDVGDPSVYIYVALFLLVLYNGSKLCANCESTSVVLSFFGWIVMSLKLLTTTSLSKRYLHRRTNTLGDYTF